LARRVENEFIGVPCGIMDQMAIAIGKPGQALALDTQSLKYELVELPTDLHMAVVHTGIFRELSEGRYKIRKEECDEVKTFLGRDDICQIDQADYESLIGLPAHIRRRAKHCMTEQARTLSAVAALKQNNIELFGRLMTQSHVSMRDDFEITLPAIDTLVRDAVDIGAAGARMTGGGFGGCIVACIKKNKLDVWRGELLNRNPEAFYVC